MKTDGLPRPSAPPSLGFRKSRFGLRKSRPGGRGGEGGDFGQPIWLLAAKRARSERPNQMTHFPILTMESAPERSKPALKQLEAAFGMIPNIAGVMASSPVLINSLVGLFGNVHGGSFTEPQIQTVLLTDAVTNECAWAVAFHTALGLKAGLDPADVEAIRERRLPNDGKHAALSLLAKTLIEKRGRLDDRDIDQFVAAGFGKDLALEVIAIVAASTITNYTGSVTRIPLEAPFQAHAWPA
ncbi:MAG: carboxymuconolactone decarboxylase family protein [Roseiarcus sp.]